MPVYAGIQNILKILDPGFRRDDGKRTNRTFYIVVNNHNALVRIFNRIIIQVAHKTIKIMYF